MTILIVNDREEILYYLEVLLKTNGFEIRKATNGIEALSLLAEEPIDLVFSDIMMPEMDGFSLSRKIRKNPQYDQLPIILYTATYIGEEDEHLAKEIGVDDFITHPCEPETILEKIDAVLKLERNINLDAQSESAEDNILKLYNTRLVCKLEQKMKELSDEIAEKSRVVETLERNQRILNATQKLGKLGGWEYYLDTKEVCWTDQLYAFHGLEPGSEISDTHARFADCYGPEDNRKLYNGFHNLIEKNIPFTHEFWLKVPNKEPRFVHVGAELDKENRRITGILQDLTERKELEARESNLQSQLRQSQKLEAIGQLAGGLAHDFNNVLTVIMGYAEEVLDSLHKSDPLKDYVKEIINAAGRAGSLTRQLLTFSSKQESKPTLININNTISNLQKMLLRLIGEQVEYEELLAENLPNVLIDEGQVEQVIMNMVINAKEAMPMGGKLTIHTFLQEMDKDLQLHHPMMTEKQYVVMTISDTGIGMDAQTKEQIFDPFFSTKERGYSSGLGLPTAYGIIKQNNGYIRVLSTPGNGTRFVVLLPVAKEGESKAEEKKNNDLIKGNEELIMIVEDDVHISRLTAKLVGRMGYKAITASNGKKAMQMIQDEGVRPKLVICDIVMPEINGLELSAMLRFTHPEIKILLMSSFSDAALKQYGERLPDIPYLPKPFTRQDLAEHIAELLKKE